MSLNSLLVSEIFGPTFQGEGPSAGQRAAFLRLGGCNLTCLGCDTPYTWRWSNELPHNKSEVYDPRTELEMLEFGQILERLGQIDARLLVVTGGEPLLQKERLTNFLIMFETVRAQYQGRRTEIETNGTIQPTPGLETYVDQWNVSPKLSHWGNGKKGYAPDVIEYFRLLPLRMGQQGYYASQVVFKFVCRNASDVSEAESLVHEHKIDPRFVWIMPEGTTAVEVLATSAAVRDATIHHGFNLTSRLHVLLWDDRRGV